MNGMFFSQLRLLLVLPENDFLLTAPRHKKRQLRLPLVQLYCCINYKVLGRCSGSSYDAFSPSSNFFLLAMRFHGSFFMFHRIALHCSAFFLCTDFLHYSARKCIFTCFSWLALRKQNERIYLLIKDCWYRGRSTVMDANLASLHWQRGWEGIAQIALANTPWSVLLNGWPLRRSTSQQKCVHLHWMFIFSVPSEPEQHKKTKQRSGVRRHKGKLVSVKSFGAQIKKFNFTASVLPQSSIFVMTAINKREEASLRQSTRERR